MFPFLLFDQKKKKFHRFILLYFKQKWKGVHLHKARIFSLQKRKWKLYDKKIL